MSLRQRSEIQEVLHPLGTREPRPSTVMQRNLEAVLLLWLDSGGFLLPYKSPLMRCGSGANFVCSRVDRGTGENIGPTEDWGGPWLNFSSAKLDL